MHRRLRPEAFGGLIHHQLHCGRRYPINEEILQASVLDRIKSHNHSRNGHDTLLLPQAFPEGSPMHPSYGAGHATVAGACVTILKAWFDESFVIPEPQVPNRDGTALCPYTRDDAGALTVGGELNKVAANVSIGRNFAGVHYRSDYTASIRLGEAIAIGILEEQKLSYNEPSAGFSFTTFDDEAVEI